MDGWMDIISFAPLPDRPVFLELPMPTTGKNPGNAPTVIRDH